MNRVPILSRKPKFASVRKISVSSLKLILEKKSHSHSTITISFSFLSLTLQKVRKSGMEWSWRLQFWYDGVLLGVSDGSPPVTFSPYFTFTPLYFHYDYLIPLFQGHMAIHTAFILTHFFIYDSSFLLLTYDSYRLWLIF